VSEPLDELFARLCSGNPAAVGQLFVAFEPFMRKALRRQIPAPLRGKFDSSDVLQSVWADLLRGFRDAGWRFSDVDHLRGFLFVATRNRLIDHIRHHRREADREEPLCPSDRALAVPSALPRPSELARAEELWERIQARCPPEHRPVLRLKRQGHSLAEIGQRTGLHPDSVRRILRTLARELAFASPAGGS
jgi:RNA polymerase sigma-70 factor (ECF subfamily)